MEGQPVIESLRTRETKFSTVLGAASGMSSTLDDAVILDVEDRFHVSFPPYLCGRGVTPLGYQGWAIGRPRGVQARRRRVWGRWGALGRGGGVSMGGGVGEAVWLERRRGPCVQALLRQPRGGRLPGRQNGIGVDIRPLLLIQADVDLGAHLAGVVPSLRRRCCPTGRRPALWSPDPWATVSA